MPARKKIMVVCASLHSDRVAQRNRHWLQPSAGLQVASQIDPSKYDVTLYHEMWHGPLGVDVPPADLVFLNSLQMDFDRQRQLAYLFKRKGAVTVAGGSICTQFPAFAGEFFDVVCSGGVDSVRDVLADFERGELRPVYYSPQTRLTDYPINYRLLTDNGIGGPLHLIEASRGCNFRCDFCVIPAENARHTRFGVDRVLEMIDNAIAASPPMSLKRLYPSISFIDNNFANNRAYARDLVTALGAHRRVRAWGALITQETLGDHELIAAMAKNKCRTLFAGIESLDPEFLDAHNKRQNTRSAGSLLADVAFAQRQGIALTYGYLFDPRMSSVERMTEQMRALVRDDALPFPSYFSFVAPLAGTPLFWDSLGRNELRPGLRLRDLDGMSIAYRDCVSSETELSEFARKVHKDPAALIGRRELARKARKGVLKSHGYQPIATLASMVNSHRVLRLSRRSAEDPGRSYLGGDDVLDPQYTWLPADLSEPDRRRFFDPIRITEADGSPAPWLQDARPPDRKLPLPSA
ncbi:radical SAM protein [Amycolatopsis sp. Hca4]|uniref:B12-binding domain-containing radical SAM protein n=1 Tax=Amycolatopsis sp. Hca4 TaxID=2742131 RepID=UPI001591ACDB|nr:radical SAM protein [Amycolatopsis sp. Hca4]QKV80727.1 hypothetical protein HUT10_48375 [Amycolatopsis sp. Hca4]